MWPTPLEHPRFRVMPRRSDQLAVFFSGSSAPDHHFHWWKVAQEIEASAILINNGSNEWYQRGVPGLGDSIDAVTEVLRAWAQALGATRLYTIGASMGGTAALMHGVPLGARVLGFGFEPRLDYRFGQVDRIMVEDCPVALNDMVPLAHESVRPIFVYAGENEPVDVMGAADLAPCPMARITTVRRVAHDPAARLRKEGQMDRIMEAFLTDHNPPGVKEPGRACEIPGYPAALYAAHCAEHMQDWPTCEAAAREALQLYPNAEMANYLLGLALVRQDQPAAALPFLSLADVLDPEMVEAEFLLGHVLRLMGEYKESIRIHRRILKARPDHDPSHFDIGQIYQLLGKPDLATREFEAALAIRPDHPPYVQKLAGLRGDPS